MKYKNIYKISQISIQSFGLKKNIYGKLPLKLLVSSNVGLFWYYNHGRPKISEDNDDYDFSLLREHVDYSIALLFDYTCEIVNWNNLEYSINYMNEHCLSDELPNINLFGISYDDRVLFANGEYGTVYRFSESSAPEVLIRLDNARVCPNNNNSGSVTQNIKDGKHSRCEASKPQWGVISWFPSEKSLKR